ncbi:MAG TPA: VOC family protein [Streptosporangiaceae bacterium]|jgi:PhnB protein
MSSRLNPYLTFSGNAREALDFYASVFGGNLSTMKYGDMGRQGPDADRVMHGQLETDAGYTIMAADISSDMQPSPISGITVSISGDDGAALRGYWEKLSAGGTVNMPLEKQAWGDEFGMCVDRFGVPWVIDIGQA